MKLKKPLTIALIALMPSILFAQGWRGNGCWGYGSPGFFGGGWMMILWTVLVIGVIFLIAKWIIGSNSKRVASNNALTILAERYAKGEISREDFLRLKEDLS